MSFWVIILAREGSKRCPGKNVMPFYGRDGPKGNIVDMCIKKGLMLGPEFVVVSTDIKEIMDKYENAKGVAVVERPLELRGDNVTSEAVVLDILKTSHPNPDYFCLLQPTSPCMQDSTLFLANWEFKEQRPQALISVNPAYQPNGCFYFCDTKTFIKERTLWLFGTWLYEMPWEESIDINFGHDFRIAEAVHAHAVSQNEAV